MKKILVIENKWGIIQKIYSKIHGKQFGGYSKIDTQQAHRIIDEMFAVLADCELKDVVEFEATVIRQEKTLGAGKFINAKIPNNLNVKDGDKLHVLAVKKKKLPNFADMKGIFRKKEEPDDPK